MNFTRACFNALKVHHEYFLYDHLYKRPLALITQRKCYITSIRSVSNIPKRTITSIEEKQIQLEPQPSFLTKILDKLPFINVEKSRLTATGFILYESIADKINYADFFDEFSLPDTFYSWFVVTELHIWLLSVRCMAEGDNGRHVRNSIVQAMWSDVGLRAKKIGAVNPSETRMQVQELSEQFQAALIAYDEGLQSDDTSLAGALWRRMYQLENVEPDHLDGLIKYIRRQVRLLDGMSRDEIFSQKAMLWGSSGKN